ncbi:YcaO-like family protein [Amaricoccus solimangrovi]|uniref:YcaO domain-containing protein n=1 Tax=Amaricoccus solimangrovi TaxID=2589815 RepID=A0A501WVK6_9RHOB|nr:YcaO-like family protein [Amaricoccus solimangrovi]TPE49916.1 hypothetical protein FJM51_13205 [Amaricoccus solimangrovi]
MTVGTAGKAEGRRHAGGNAPFPGIETLSPERMDPLPKALAEGTHRTERLEVTLARILPRMAEFGITRLARLTGLDRLGIEVTMATQPNARGVSVANGKGLCLPSARVSALMEAVERWHAERPDLAPRFGLPEDVARPGCPAWLDGLPRRPEAAAEPGPILWAEARDLMTGGPALLPFDLVHCNWLEGVSDHGFHTSTNGLASGTHPVEAALHGLCEVIERDACALFDLLPPELRAGRRLGLAEAPGGAVAALVARAEAAGFRLALWDATSDVGVAVVMAALIDTRAPDTPPGFGSGCHPDPGVAAARAITEAAQTRLIAITGTRDDLGPEVFAGTTGLRFRWAARETGAPARDWAALPDLAGDCLRADLARVVAALARVAKAAFAVDLSREPGIAVLRVIVPGLEPAGPSEVRPGPRAARAAEIMAGATA